MIEETSKLKGNVIIKSRDIKEKNWKIKQIINNTVTTFGQQWILDTIAGTAGSIQYFEVGGGGRETQDIATSGGSTGSVPFGLTGSERVMQPFYTATGALSRIVLRPAADTGNATDDIVVSLFRTSGTQEGNPTGLIVPTGTALTTQYVRDRDWVNGSDIGFNIRDISNITIGSRYAVEIRRSGTTLSTTDYRWVNVFTGSDTYTSGITARLSGTTWTSMGSIDFRFTTYYPTYNGAPIAKTTSSNALVIPTLNKAITSTSRAGTTLSVTNDIASTEANAPGKISEIRLRPSSTGSAISTVAFRDEEKTETNEMQIIYQITFV